MVVYFSTAATTRQSQKNTQHNIVSLLTGKFCLSHDQRLNANQTSAPTLSSVDITHAEHEGKLMGTTTITTQWNNQYKVGI